MQSGSGACACLLELRGGRGEGVPIGLTLPATAGCPSMLDKSNVHVGPAGRALRVVAGALPVVSACGPSGSLHSRIGAAGVTLGQKSRKQTGMWGKSYHHPVFTSFVTLAFFARFARTRQTSVAYFPGLPPLGADFAICLHPHSHNWTRIACRLDERACSN